MIFYSIHSVSGQTLKEEISFEKSMSEGYVTITGFEVRLRLGKKERFPEIKKQFEMFFPRSDFQKVNAKEYYMQHEFHFPIPVSSEADIMRIEEKIQLAMPCALGELSGRNSFILLCTNQYWKQSGSPDTIDLERAWCGFEFGELASPTFKAKITSYEFCPLSDLPDELRSEAFKRIVSKLLANHPKPTHYSIEKDHVLVEWPYPFHNHGFEIYEKFVEHKRKWGTDPLDCGPESFWATDESDESNEYSPDHVEHTQL